MEDDRATARRAAREHLARYLRLDNYRRSFLRQGFGERDLSGGSDRLVDGAVACGGPAAVAARVRQHLDAGADHVAVQVVGWTGTPACAASGSWPASCWRPRPT